METTVQTTLLSSCARAATAEEARFRVNYPNSRTRDSLIIALDEGSAQVMAGVTEEPWNGAHFLTVVYDQDLSPQAEDLVLKNLDGSLTKLSEEIEEADVVIMLSTTTRGREAAETIGTMAFGRAIMTAGLVINEAVEEVAKDEVVESLRPFASVLVVAAEADYVPAMLTALRA